MAHLTENDAKALDQLWSRLGDTRSGMLWVEGADQHPQPMTHFKDREENALWFITASDTDLSRAIAGEVKARFAYVSEKGDYHASLLGNLSISDDKAKLDALWNVAADAWFEGGRSDPKVTLLKFSLTEAAVWATQANALLVGLKMMKAALSDGDDDPSVGTHHVIPIAA